MRSQELLINMDDRIEPAGIINALLEHDPEKHALGLRPDGCAAVFRKDHAQSKT
jgi:hypothetical protein